MKPGPCITDTGCAVVTIDRRSGLMERYFFAAGTVFAALAVMAGAFGAHGLKNKLGPEMMAVFEIAVRYQMYHALGLLAVAFALSRYPSRFGVAAGWLFCIGIVFFSGSLYMLALSGTLWLGAVTPLGGVMFVLGWLFLLGTAMFAGRH